MRCYIFGILLTQNSSYCLKYKHNAFYGVSIMKTIQNKWILLLNVFYHNSIYQSIFSTASAKDRTILTSFVFGSKMAEFNLLSCKNGFSSSLFLTFLFNLLWSCVASCPSYVYQEFIELSLIGSSMENVSERDLVELLTYNWKFQIFYQGT